MTRKTPPIANQVTIPYLASNALLKARLVDFDTGSPQLETQHKTWLATNMQRAAQNSMYRIRLVGYASKLGTEDSNSNLSYARIDNTLRYMQSVDTNAMDRVETFRAVGEGAYSASESDDSAQWRAVEAHILIGDLPWSPPPPSITPVPRPVQPLPGGERFTQWEIACVGGAFVAAIAGGGYNVFLIRNPKTRETRGYIQPVAGVGGGLGLKNLSPVRSAVQTLVTGVGGSPLDYTTVTSRLPVTWDELEGCLVRVTSFGGAIGVGLTYAVVTFTVPQVTQRGPSGLPVFVIGGNLPGGVLFQFQGFSVSRPALGLGGSMVLGPLVRVA